jgi:organic radical activating enzyme
MKIHNVRLGHATNSSSSHSMIFAPNQNIHDDYDDFGWSFFTVASEEGKKQYLAATLRQNLSGDFPEPLIDVILTGLGLPEVEKGPYRYELHVDHQSQYNFPKEFGSNTLSIDFFNEFKDYILRDGIIILGGNDNTEEQHCLSGAGTPVDFGAWQPEMSDFVCRKDGDWWTLYSPHSGNRIVLTFNDNAAPYQPITPVLMDVKITDYCTHGCAYCYQGSTPQGEHMDKDKLYAYVGLISEAKVFEVAIGGGEPTQCPHFPQFIRWLHEAGVTVNFTTKSIDWLEDETRAKLIVPYIGAFAFSAAENSVADLERIQTIMKYRGYRQEMFTVQIVPATMGEYAFTQLLKWCNTNRVRVTLLGYKETGRGAKFKEIGIVRSWNKFNEDEWLNVVKKLNASEELGRLCIDTTLAAKYEQAIKNVGIPDWMFHIEEGKYSMYMDLVKHQYGPSSYHLDKLQTFELYKETVEDMFSTIEAV